MGVFGGMREAERSAGRWLFSGVEKDSGCSAHEAAVVPGAEFLASNEDSGSADMRFCSTGDRRPDELDGSNRAVICTVILLTLPV